MGPELRAQFLAGPLQSQGGGASPHPMTSLWRYRMGQMCSVKLGSVALD